MKQFLPDDPDLSPLSLVFHPLFWGLDRKRRSHSYIPSEPLGNVYWIGLHMGSRIGTVWTEAMSLRETCEKAAASVGIELPCPLSDVSLLNDLALIAHHEAFQRLLPVPYPYGTSLEEMERGGPRYVLHMKGSWWIDWRLYGNIPFDLTGVIRSGAAEIRHPHQEEYAPWECLDKLMVPILGPCQRYWYMHWGRPYGVHLTWTISGELHGHYLGDPLDLVKMTPDEVRSLVPMSLLEHVEQARRREFATSVDV